MGHGTGHGAMRILAADYDDRSGTGAAVGLIVLQSDEVNSNSALAWHVARLASPHEDIRP